MKALLDSQSIVVLVSVWASLWTGAQAQSTNATCSTQFKWMENSRGQSPCLVAAYLSQQCIAGTWTVPAIMDQGPYNPPTGQGVSQCRCSSVVYSLLSACSICQAGRVGTWANWIASCPTTMVTIGSFPTTVPSGTHIPVWTQLDPTRTGGSFDVQLAKTAYDQSGSKKDDAKPTNWGAIIGGAAGGIGVIALLGVLGWYLLRRRRYQAMLRIQGGGLNTPLDPVKVQKMKPGDGAYKELDMDPLLPSDDLGSSAPQAGGIRQSYDASGMIPSTTPSSSYTSFSHVSVPPHPPPNYTTGQGQQYYDPYTLNRTPSRQSLQYNQGYTGAPLPRNQFS